MEKHKVSRMVGLLVFLSGGITWAQVTTGTISGTVRDSTGAVLPGAQVVLLNEETGISRTVQPDGAGHYSALSLSLGNYRVTGTLEGFQTEVRSGIVLTVGREAVVDLALSVGASTQRVEVTGEAPLVESTSAALGSLVDGRAIRALPLNGRSYDQLALLQPGVIQASVGATSGASASFAYGTAKRFSVGGQRTTSNSFLMDGTNINDQGNGSGGGAAGTNLGVDTILEFKIFTNSFKAEYGHAMGSVTSAITRSGTNTLHGTAFEYIRNSALDARGFFDVGSSPPPFKRNQFGGVLGGPIKKDKTFFFAGYEGLRQGQGTTLTANVPTALAKQGILPTGTVKVNPIVVPFLDLYPLPNGRVFGDGTGEFQSAPSVITNEDNFMLRVDHQLNAKTGIFGRYTFDNDSQNAPQNLPNQFVISASRRQYTTLQANRIVSPKAINNLRFAFNRTTSAFAQDTIPDTGLTFVPGQGLGVLGLGGVAGQVSSTITAMGNGSAPYFWAYNILEGADDFSYVRGKHSLKTGVDIQRMRDNYQWTSNVRGAYTFTTFNDFLAGKAVNVKGTSPLGIPPGWGARQTLFAVYGQDDYKVNSRLTLNLGLRWEVATDPTDVRKVDIALLPSPSATAMVLSDSFFHITKKNFEPRVGLAWRLDASGKTVVRAGGGIYHNQILPYHYFSYFKNPPLWNTISLNNPPFPNGLQQAAAAFIPSLSGNGLISLSVTAPVQKTPVDDQYNVSIQHEIFRNAVIEVAYAGNKANHLLISREVDTPIPTMLGPNNPFYPAGAPRRNPAWAGIRMNDDIGNSIYNSLTVTLRRQASSGLVGQIFYTFSKSMDEMSIDNNASSARSPGAPLDPANIRRDWARSEFDATHVVVANFSYPLPFRAGSKTLGAIVNGWTLDGIGTIAAGQPFTVRLSSTQSRDQASVNFAERPDLKLGASQNPTQGTSAGCAGFPAGKKLGGADNFYDPCSFALPLAGTYGNVGRNTIIGPGVVDVDLTLEKSFKLHEKATVTFRAEVFNIMNHTNLGIPNPNALIAGTSGAASPSAGRVAYTTTSSRQLQFALRIDF